MIICLTIVSFFMDGMVSNIVPMDSLFLPLFSITALVLIFPYFKKNKRNDFFKICAFMGFLYDIVYTDTLFINILLFCLVGFITYYASRTFADNGINFTIALVISIIVYRFVSYIFYLPISGNEFSGIVLLEGIYRSFILNIIYGLTLYLITEKISHRFRIYRM